MLRVLTYHRVADMGNTPWLNPRLISATPAVFDRQMRHLADHYDVVSMEEVLDAVKKRVPLPRRAVLLTFDDAYCDFGEVAWPILKRHRLPATLFVPTAYPDQPERRFWWDRLYQAVAYTSRTEFRVAPLGSIHLGTPEQRRTGLRKIQDYVKAIPYTKAMVLIDRICAELGQGTPDRASVLGWDQLRQLAKEGVTLGAHTRTHPVLNQVSPEQIREEIRGSQEDLRREIGSVLPIFCYPSGSHDDLIVRILKEEGFMMAFTTLDGQNALGSVDLLRLCRTNITRRTSLPIFRLRLHRLAAYLDMWRHRKQRRAQQVDYRYDS